MNLKLHFVLVYLFISTVALYTCLAIAGNTSVKLVWNRLVKVSLDSDGQVLTIDSPLGVPSDTAFLLLQGHQLPSLSYNANQLLQLSTLLEFNRSDSVTKGHHIGLVTMETSLPRWYARLVNDEQLNNSGSTKPSYAWLLIVAKAWDEPLPGGCCTNRSLPWSACNSIGPAVNLSRPAASCPIWQLDFHPAAGLKTNKPNLRICHSKSQTLDSSGHRLKRFKLRYRLYVAEVTHGDWPAALRLMSTAQDAVAYGHLIGVISNSASVNSDNCCRFTVGSRDNINLIATVVAERVDTSQFSAYAPVLITINENNEGFAGSACLCFDFECRTVSILAALVGLFLCTAGFRFFAASVFLCGFINGSLVFLPVTLRQTAAQLSMVASLLLGCLAPGLIFGGIALVIWLRKRWNWMAYLILHLPCCYALASLLFATPFGQLWWLTGHEAAFLGALGAAVLLCLLLLLLFSSSGAIFSLSFVGAFMLTAGLTANLPVSSIFPYLFLDLFRRTATENYNGALLYYEFRRVADLAALIGWPIVTAVCCLLQYRCNRKLGLDPGSRGNIEPGFEPTLPLPPPPPTSSLAAAAGAGDGDERRTQQRLLNVSFIGDGVFRDGAGDRAPLIRQ
ncbi:hypothetical protein BOX15_Mlig024786g1 [Macrostomum lignano]|uniref:TM7S3/TM198-like domain-containing protein n=1 Tax=Macrostomum lignano TaxID=282301 RepID=A0A267EBA2_9PLAT|nr:hypothetical protein BOX15_Mlig024786g1 [Macrostomum lignano]